MGRKSQGPAAAAGDTAVVENPATTEEKVSRRIQWRRGTMVTLTEKGSTNPKKANSASHSRYEVLLAACKGGKAVSVESLFAAGYRMDDYRHDLAHDFISSVEPFVLGQQTAGE